MPSAPLTPFHPPQGLPFHSAITPTAAIEWVLAAVLLFWVAYTLVAAYHWIRFSHAAAVAYPAITLHLAVSACLMLYIFFVLV